MTIRSKQKRHRSLLHKLELNRAGVASKRYPFSSRSSDTSLSPRFEYRQKSIRESPSRLRPSMIEVQSMDSDSWTLFLLRPRDEIGNGDCRKISRAEEGND